MAFPYGRLAKFAPHTIPIDLVEQATDRPGDALHLLGSEADAEVVLRDFVGVVGEGQVNSPCLQARRHASKTEQETLFAEVLGILVEVTERRRGADELVPLASMLVKPPIA